MLCNQKKIPGFVGGRLIFPCRQPAGMAFPSTREAPGNRKAKHERSLFEFRFLFRGVSDLKTSLLDRTCNTQYALALVFY